MNNFETVTPSTKTKETTVKTTTVFKIISGDTDVEPVVHHVTYSRITALRLRNEMKDDFFNTLDDVRILRTKMITVDGVNYTRETHNIVPMNKRDEEVLSHKNKMEELKETLKKSGLSLNDIRTLLEKDDSMKNA